MSVPRSICGDPLWIHEPTSNPNRSNQIMKIERLAPLSLILAAGLAYGGVAGPTINSAADGLWGDASTWDTFTLPVSSDVVGIGHHVHVPSGTSVNAGAIRVGGAMPGMLTSDANISIPLDFFVGLDGNFGIATLEDLTASSIQIGRSAEGMVTVRDNSILETLPSGAVGAMNFRVGTEGHDGTLILDGGRVVARSGMRVGPDGIVMVTENQSLNPAGPFVNPLFDVSGGDFEWDFGGRLDLTRADIPDNTVVGDQLLIATYSDGLVGLNINRSIGYNGTLNFSTPGVITYEVLEVPQAFEWTNPGTSTFSIDTNWAGGEAPGFGGFASIRNGGTAISTATARGGGLSQIRLNELVVGDQNGDGSLIASGTLMTVVGEVWVGAGTDPAPTTGSFPSVDGTLTVTDAPFFTVTGFLNVGDALADGDASMTAVGNLTIERVTDVYIGGDLDTGAPFADNNPNGDPMSPLHASASGTGNLIIRDCDTVFVDGDFDISDGGASATLPGSATATQISTVLVENVNTYTVGFDLDIAQSSSNPGETEVSDIDVTFRDVGVLNIGFDLDTLLDGAYGVGADAGANIYDGDIRFIRTNVNIGGDIDFHSTVDIAGDGIVQAEARMLLEDCTMIVAPGDTAEFCAIEADNAGTPGPGAPGNFVRTDVTMVRSRLAVTDALKNGRRLEAQPGELEGIFRLDEASMIDIDATGFLELGEGSRLMMHIDGALPVSPAIVGSPGFHSSIGCGTAMLDGSLEVIFDIPATTGQRFDIITAGTDILGDFSNVTASGAGLPFGTGVQAGIDFGMPNVYYVIVSCAGDADGNGMVNFDDLNVVLSGWGVDYDFDDLNAVLANWDTECFFIPE